MFQAASAFCEWYPKFIFNVYLLPFTALHFNDTYNTACNTVLTYEKELSSYRLTVYEFAASSTVGANIK